MNHSSNNPSAMRSRPAKAAMAAFSALLLVACAASTGSGDPAAGNSSAPELSSTLDGSSALLASSAASSSSSTTPTVLHPENYTSTPYTAADFLLSIEGPAVDAQGNLYAVSFGSGTNTIGLVDTTGHASLFATLPAGS